MRSLLGPKTHHEFPRFTFAWEYCMPFFFFRLELQIQTKNNNKLIFFPLRWKHQNKDMSTVHTALFTLLLKLYLKCSSLASSSLGRNISGGGSNNNFTLFNSCCDLWCRCTHWRSSFLTRNVSGVKARWGDSVSNVINCSVFKIGL